ncbi:nitrogen fixation protein NifB [Sporomusaceae bacterium BoRhaA]|uniref:nitrogenase cofactor biosynthesis protein NifB n=1 Tax=Pelorhabdus rhamnosifermentans TaxID=2772457 RepID=UPI001C05F2B5|nr:nitrogenase cofactor biosynthesis protein NifB [Pelorhabdus rhamnosifermentans]MBU2702103.1 nitrogen fixation protein NifB [Pelorhabdus rhamnosifermentans]
MTCTRFSGEDRPLSGDLAVKTAMHPCYSLEAHHQYARMHIPVAPACNISCNYCNRKFDCVNESRPGVTSEVLTPELSQKKFQWVKREMPNLSVVGIAGPGDALANWDQVKRSIELIKAVSPEIIFCLSTNGLMLPEYAQEIIKMDVKHVTITMNCLDAAIGAKLYRYVDYHGQRYSGEKGASLLNQNQLEGLSLLTQGGVLVKVNIVMVPGINDRHIPQVVRKARDLGAFVTNIMPLIPAPGSVFEFMPQTSMKEINKMRDTCQIDLRQMRHCQQCRADAIGLLEQDQSHQYRFTQSVREAEPATSKKIYKIAVTTKYNRLVDLHYGHAKEFYVYQVSGSKSCLVEIRQTPQYCHGIADCDASEAIKREALETLTDCDALLTMRIGDSAQKRLEQKGILVVESCNSVEEGLVYAYKKLESPGMLCENARGII